VVSWNDDWKILFKTQDRWLGGVQQTLVTPSIDEAKAKG
jgi:hypothetical protein